MLLMLADKNLSTRREKTMEANAKAVRDILHSSDQFLVPFFQRYYSWQREHWDRLRSDVWALFDDGARKQHFLGPLVCALLDAMPGDVHVFQLIDGQQRLMTLSLFLAAIRDVALTIGEPDLAQEIEETFLIHKFKKGLQRYKIIPRLGDREAFIALVDRKPHDTFAALRMLDAYQYFRKLVRYETLDKPARLRELFETIVGRLYLVVITIGEENPYEIFESLNSTGLPLKEADLIRNYLFMQLETDEQQCFQTDHWGPYEKLFDPDGSLPAIGATAFYRDFLMRNGVYSRDRSTFVDFKKYHEDTRHTPDEAVAELSQAVRLYLSLYRNGAGQPPTIAKLLSRFEMLDAATAYPLLLNLLDRFDRKQVSESELAGCISDLSSFIIRRSVCVESTRTYGRWFCEAIQYLRNSPRDDLQGYLLHRGWPDDESFKKQLVEFPIYRREFKKCRVVLHALEESFAHKEQVDLDSLQIEHIMPQTLPRGKAGAAWREMLGLAANQVHSRWQHTLGNLTLTGYNPKLGNKSFKDKQAEFLASKVSLNGYFSDLKEWSETAIRDRGKELAEEVGALWPRPKSDMPYKLVSAAQIEKPKAGRERRKAYWCAP